VVDGLLLEIVELERVLATRRTQSQRRERTVANQARAQTHLEGHIGNEFVEVHEVLLNVNDMRPLPLFDHLLAPFGLLGRCVRQR
jgi:hypothetical protein